MRKEVKICGVNYKIKQKQSIDNDESIQGIIYHTKAEINVKKNMPKDLKESVLFHEIVHGILTNLGYAELNTDEQFVQCLSNALYQMFKLK